MRASRLGAYTLAAVGWLLLAAAGLVVFVEMGLIAMEVTVFDPVAALLILGLVVVLVAMGVALIRDARRLRDKG